MSVTLSVTVLLAGYTMGLLRFLRQAGPHRAPSVMRVLAMVAGLLVIQIALASPLDELADELLSAHMAQHLLLMLIAAPLLVAARPTPYLVWSLPRSFRRMLSHLWVPMGLSRGVRLLEAPVLCWSAFCATVIFWHIPALYRWAMAGESRHALMHLNFLVAALLFWSVVLAPIQRRKVDHAAASLYVISAALLTGLPGVLITFARHPLYVNTSDALMPFGFTALADQQLAGLIMWIPMDLILFAVALALFGLALRTSRSNAPGGELM